jgi:radical SAM protein with 4Fe4S-binding SPASM domain
MNKNFGLHLAIIELTDDCNLKCKHCYEKFDGKNLIRFHDYKKLINDLKNIGCRYIYLTGGEPLLLGNDLIEYAKYAKKFNLITTLITNGTLLSNIDDIQMLKIFDHIQISVDGLEKTHNFIRGAGTFKKAISAVNTLKNITPVTIMMTIHKLNMNDLLPLHQLSKKLNVRLAIERYTPTVLNKFIKPLDPLEFKSVLEIALKHNIHITDPLFNVIANKKIRRGGCTAGIAALVVGANLDVYPCVRLRKKVGNIKKSSIKNIWKNSFYLKKLRSRELIKGKCKFCKYSSICGGCRAYAFVSTGDEFDEDTMCWIT